MVTSVIEPSEGIEKISSGSIKYNGSSETTTVSSQAEETVRSSSSSDTEESINLSKPYPEICERTDMETKPYISEQALYPTGSFESTALYTWVAARKKLAEGIICIDTAVNSFDDEIEREIQLNNLYGILRELSLIQDFNMDFESIISVMRASLYRIIIHEAPLSPTYLIKLREHVFKRMRDNVNLHEKVFGSTIGAIAEYQLDLISLGLGE